MFHQPLLNSLRNAQKHDTPWEYFTFGQCLNEAQIEEIRGADIEKSGVLHDGTRSGYKDGVEKQNHSLREYITIHNRSKYPNLVNFIREMQGLPVRKEFAFL